jgi:hypothetical protein
MPLSDDDLEVERRKAKHLAMRQALQMIESAPNQLCSSCAEWQDKYVKDSRHYCRDIEQLRKVVQVMIDTLATYISGARLHELVDTLLLDTRMFNVPCSTHCYMPPKDGSNDASDMSMELKARKAELEQAVAERDLAKMSLFKTGRELAGEKKAKQDLERQLAEKVKEAQHQRHLFEDIERQMNNSGARPLSGLRVGSGKPQQAVVPMQSVTSLSFPSQVDPWRAAKQSRQKLYVNTDNPKSKRFSPDFTRPPRESGIDSQKNKLLRGDVGSDELSDGPCVLTRLEQQCGNLIRGKQSSSLPDISLGRSRKMLKASSAAAFEDLERWDCKLERCMGPRVRSSQLI